MQVSKIASTATGPEPHHRGPAGPHHIHHTYSPIHAMNRSALLPIARAIAIAWMAAQLLITAAAVAAAITWQHREQIRAIAIAAIAATYTAGAWTRYQAGRAYRAGAWCRMQLEASSEALGRWYAALLVPTTAQAPAQALPPAPAPIVAVRDMLDLSSLSQRELMQLAGTRRKLSKRQLLQLLA